MHTFGAIILAFIGTLLMQLVLSFVSSFLFAAMYSSTGMVLIPLLLMVAMTGCAYYGGMYFALKLVPKANPKTTMLTMMGLVALGTLWSISKGSGSNDSVPVLMTVLNGAAGIVGYFFARISAEMDRIIETSRE